MDIHLGLCIKNLSDKFFLITFLFYIEKILCIYMKLIFLFKILCDIIKLLFTIYFR